MESNVFEEANMDRTDLVLLGASHLSKIRKHLNEEQWNVFDLTKPGWRINADTVKDMVAEVTVMAVSVNWAPPQSSCSCLTTALIWLVDRVAKRLCRKETTVVPTT
jgi:hypothetical protein